MTRFLLLKRMLRVAAFQLAVLAFVMPASAQEIVYEGMTYTVLDEAAKTVELTSVPADISGEVSLPATITDADQTYTVTSIGFGVFRRCFEITGVKIPNSVIRIGQGAFDECIGLTEIVIPESVTEIGNSAFSRCAYLTSVILPSTLTKIGPAAFDWCRRLISINIPGSVTYIGNSAFEYCSDLTSIKIPSSVTWIGEDAFRYCSGMVLIEVAEDNKNYCAVDGVLFDKAMTTAMFCVQAKSGEYILPNSVAVVSPNAFENCSELTSITLPASLTSVDVSAFEGCSKLESINVDENNASYCSVDGVLLDKEMRTLIKCPAAKAGEFTIPSTVTTISKGGFKGCIGLTGVVLPDLLIAIDAEAFYGCNQLGDVIFPNSLVSIGTSAFKECGMTKIVIPNSVTSLGESAFEYCSNATDITVGQGVSRLLCRTFGGYGDYQGEVPVVTTLHLNAVTLDEYSGWFGSLDGGFSFDGRNLTTIYFGEEVQRLCGYAFSECNNTIKDIYCASTTPPELGEECFKLTDKATCVLHVPSGAKSAYESAYIWKDFLNIVDDVAGVDEVATDAEADVTVYDLSGIKVYEGQRDRMDLPTGIYIQVCGGKTTKVAIR